MKNSDLLQQHSADLKEITAAMKEDKNYILNLADDRQYNYIKNLYALNGMDAKRYPTTFKTLEENRKEDLQSKKPSIANLNYKMDADSQGSGFYTLAKVTSVGTTSNGSEACASAFLSVIGGVTVAYLHLAIYDESHNLICQSKKNVATGEFIAIQTSGGVPTENMTAFLTYSYTPVGGNPFPYNMTSGTYKNGQGDPTILEPVQKPSHSTNADIRIALSRGTHNNNDVDYWFNKGSWANTTIIVPFVGSVKFTNPVDLDSLEVLLTVALLDGGVNTIPSSPNNLNDYFTLSEDKLTLSWNFPANGTEPGSEGNPVVYGTAPWVSGTITYFFASLSINPVGSHNREYVFIQSTDMADETEDDGISYIKPLKFLWHCLAEGSLVTLADGSQLPIEKIDNSYSVMIDEEGNSLPVLATTLARAKDNEVLRIVTKTSDELILSKKHLVSCGTIMKRAEDLKVGEFIGTRNGQARIALIEHLTDHSGHLYNLELGYDGRVPVNGSTFFANDILVGDFQMQSHYGRNAHHDKDYVLAHLPNEWHLDYLSSLEDQ